MRRLADEWAGVASDDPAELVGLDHEDPWPDGPDRAEIAQLERDLRAWARGGGA